MMVAFSTVRHRNARRFRRGFTLIEAAIVTVLIGVGVMAVMQLLAAGTMANAESAELTTAIGLAGNVRERAIRVPYQNLFATFKSKTYSPPVDATGTALTNFGTWSQVVTIDYLDPDNLTFAVPDTQVEPTARMSVTIKHNNAVVYTVTWTVAAPKWPLP